MGEWFARIRLGGGNDRGGLVSGLSALAQMERGGEGLAAYKGGKRSLARVLRSCSGGSGAGWTRWAVRLRDGDGRRVPRSGDEFPGGANGDGTSRGGLGERAGDTFT